MKILFVLSYLNVLFLLYNLISIFKVRKISKLFFSTLLVLISLLIWSIGHTMLFVTRDPDMAWLIMRIASIGWIFLPGASLLFFLVYSGKEIKKIYKLLLFLPSTLVWVISMVMKITPLAISTVWSGSNLGYAYSNHWNNPLYWFYVLLIVSSFGIGLNELFKSAIDEERVAGRNSKLVLITMDALLVTGAIVVDVLYSQLNNNLPPLSHISLVGFSLAIQYISRNYNIYGDFKRISSDYIFDEIKDLIIVVNPEGVILRYNNRVTNFLGYERKELMDQSIHKIVSNQTYKSGIDDLINQMGIIRNREMNIINKSGNEIPVMASVRALGQAPDEVLGYVVVFKDITRRVQIEKEMLQSHDQYKQMKSKLQYFADYDLLTELPNRRRFFEHLDALAQVYEKNGENFCLLYMDLNHFKKVNDAYGHSTGDKVLVLAAKELTSILKNRGMVGRISGDEFLMTVNEGKAVNNLRTVIEEIRELGLKEFDIDGFKFNLSFAVGFSSYAMFLDVNKMVKAADELMYIDKQSRYAKEVL